MGEFFVRSWDHLMGRMSGPFHFRFFFQPMMASLIAIRAGFRDARTNRPPYFWALCTERGRRRSLLREGWKDVMKVFVVAFMIDVVYQIVVLHWYYPIQALIVAFVLAAIPYLLIRGPAARLAGQRSGLFFRKAKISKPPLHPTA